MHRAHRFLGRIAVVLVVAAALFACAGGGDSPPAEIEPLDASPAHRDAAVDAAPFAPDGSIDAGRAPDATVGAGGDDASREAASPVPDAALDAASIDAPSDDGASPPDSSLPDSALPDAALPDASLPDSSLPDAETADASDASRDVPDAGPPDSSEPDAARVDSAVPDATVPDASLPDASPPDAATCTATCTGGLSFLGSSAAFITGGRALDLLQDTVPAGSTVSAITQSYPAGAAQSVHAVYTTDAFVTSTDVLLTYDHPAGNNDQWYVVLPAQPAGSAVTVTWYLYAVGCDCARIYDSAGGRNFSYFSN